LVCHKTGIPDVISGNITYSSCKKKCQIFLDCFEEKFHNDFDVTTILKCLNYLENIQTTEDFVRKLLLDLKIDKQGGDDGINNKMLKLIANPIAGPLNELFNIILQNGVFPSCWKRGILVPIYKNSIIGKLLTCNSSELFFKLI
jgi:hypothetical protein